MPLSWDFIERWFASLVVLISVSGNRDGTEGWASTPWRQTFYSLA
jgi:hypothetical protein